MIYAFCACALALLAGCGGGDADLSSPEAAATSLFKLKLAGDAAAYLKAADPKGAWTEEEKAAAKAEIEDWKAKQSKEEFGKLEVESVKVRHRVDEKARVSATLVSESGKKLSPEMNLVRDGDKWRPAPPEPAPESEEDSAEEEGEY